MRLLHAIQLLSALAWSLLSVSVRAETGSATVVEAVTSVVHPKAPEALSGIGDVVHIRVGRALDLEGAPVFPARSIFSQTASITRFSDRPTRNFPAGSTTVNISGSPLRATMTSGFGMRFDPILRTRRLHSGVDLAAPSGSPIVATSGGMVSRAGLNGGYGLYVALEHGGGLQSRYGHMSRLNVVAGQRVNSGDVIGYVGSTGRSTGPHLHFETRLNGQAVQPSIPRSR